MPLVFQKIIKREDLRGNPRVLYLFGDNAQGYGRKGQAAEMRGEPNAVGIPTKWKPGMGEDDFFRSGHGDAEMRYLVDSAFEPLYEHARLSRVIVCPLDGLGTGLAQLPERCPEIYEVIRDHIRRLYRMR